MSGGDSGPRGDAFSAWLVQQMNDKKLSGADLARMVQEHLPEGVHFTPSNISHYRSGRSVPRALVREVIEKIVSGNEARTSKPSGGAEIHAHALKEGDMGDRIQLEDLGSGRARILIDQQLPWAEALELIKRLKLNHNCH
jgi:hypothetical protein